LLIRFEGETPLFLSSRKAADKICFEKGETPLILSKLMVVRPQAMMGNALCKTNYTKYVERTDIHIPSISII